MPGEEIAMNGEHGRRPDWPPAFGRLESMFEEWFRSRPMRRSQGSVWGEAVEEPIVRVDEYRDGGTLVIRAELPGIDPDRDVETPAADGMPRISAERRAEETPQARQSARCELKYGRSTR